MVANVPPGWHRMPPLPERPGARQGKAATTFRSCGCGARGRTRQPRAVFGSRHAPVRDGKRSRRLRAQGERDGEQYRARPCALVQIRTSKGRDPHRADRAGRRGATRHARPVRTGTRAGAVGASTTKTPAPGRPGEPFLVATDVSSVVDEESGRGRVPAGPAPAVGYRRRVWLPKDGGQETSRRSILRDGAARARRDGSGRWHDCSDG